LGRRTLRLSRAAGSVVKRDEWREGKAVVKNAQVGGRASGVVLHAVVRLRPAFIADT